MPAGGTKPKARIVAHVRTGSRRWIGAAAVGDVARNGVMPGQLMRSRSAGSAGSAACRLRQLSPALASAQAAAARMMAMRRR